MSYNTSPTGQTVYLASGLISLGPPSSADGEANSRLAFSSSATSKGGGGGGGGCLPDGFLVGDDASPSDDSLKGSLRLAGDDKAPANDS